MHEVTQQKLQVYTYMQDTSLQIHVESRRISTQKITTCNADFPIIPLLGKHFHSLRLHYHEASCSNVALSDINLIVMSPIPPPNLRGQHYCSYNEACTVNFAVCL